MEETNGHTGAGCARCAGSGGRVAKRAAYTVLFFGTGASKALAATGHQVRKTTYTNELMHGETLQAPLRTRSP